ncbi:MAG: type III pantothenate kinase [Calditrichaeota bacterium]|nr:type III pantothenate kinase [Calditrichota bacterium]MCB9391175.1 type III pantothenate kinase [Calditrichota bacterium]
MSEFIGIDVGNSHTTIGYWSEGKWLHEWRLSSSRQRTSDEWSVLLDGVLSRLGGFEDRGIPCGIASVVPHLTLELSRAMQSLGYGLTVVTNTHLKSIRLDYDPPTAIGPDRLCGVAAAVSRFGAPLIVVDLGTATVLDAVTSEHVYIGGVIAPGVATAADSLSQSTALLPRVELEFPPRVIGRTTRHAIQSGILHGALAMVDGLVEKMKREVGAETVIATGGFAELIHSRSTTITSVEQTLVLEGVRLLCTGEWS